MNFITVRRVATSFVFLAMLMAVCTLQAAELRPVDGEFRYYENGELVEHQQGIRALPDSPQPAQTLAVATTVADEDSPESTATAVARLLVEFETQPEPDTDEQLGDPVCVVTTYEGEVSTTTDGAVADASASIGGFDSPFTETQVDADNDLAFAATGASLPSVVVNPSSTDPVVMHTFNSVTVGADDSGNTSGEFHFIALIGDSLGIEAGSVTTAVAVYPANAEAQASSAMIAELQENILDCQLALVTLVESGDGSIDVSPEQADYQFGDSVEITAVADEGWVFSGWSGDVESMDNPLTVTISNNTEVFATFERQPPPALAVPVNATTALVLLVLLMMLIGSRALLSRAA